MVKKKKLVLVLVIFLVVGWLSLSGQLVRKSPLPGKIGISAELKAFPKSYNGTCPTTIAFKGRITVPKPMTVQYKFIRSDGAIAPVQTLVFSAAGTKAVSTSWTIGKSYTGWQAIEILSPQSLQSNQANFSITCTPKPNITSIIRHHYGHAKPQIDLIGNNFGASQGTKIVLVDGAPPVSIIHWSNTQVSIDQGMLIPWEHTYQYSINEGGNAISNVFSQRFPYQISHFTPTGGAAAGAEFTVYVWNLPTAPGGLEVRLGTHICPVTSWSGGPGGTIKVRVPAGLSPGTYPLALWKGGVKASVPETMNFTVL